MTHTTVLTLILVGGVLAVIGATVADYRSHRRVEAAMRRAAGLGPEPVERPSYVSAEELAAGAPHAEKTDAEFEDRLSARLADGGVELPLGLASERFASHTGQRAILEDVLVMVCVDEPSQIRELLPVLRAVSAQPANPLVIAAPGFAENVLNTLAANRLAGTIPVYALVGDADALQKLADCSGAFLCDRPARQSGAMNEATLGQLELLVADLEQSSVLAVKQ